MDLGLNDILITQPIEHSTGADQVGHLCAKGASVVATADSRDHLALLNHAAQALSTTIFLSIDVDVSADPGGRTEIREVQSLIKDSEQARQIASKIAEMEHLKLTGIQATLPAQIRAQSTRWKRRKQTKVLAAIQDRRVAVVHASDPMVMTSSWCQAASLTISPPPPPIPPLVRYSSVVNCWVSEETNHSPNPPWNGCVLCHARLQMAG